MMLSNLSLDKQPNSRKNVYLCIIDSVSYGEICGFAKHHFILLQAFQYLPIGIVNNRTIQ